MTRRALIGLGSNLGDRRAILDGAVAALAGTPGVTLDGVSAYHETAPVGGPAGQGPEVGAALGNQVGQGLAEADELRGCVHAAAKRRASITSWQAPMVW